MARTAAKSLTANLSKFFDADVRARGGQYAADGCVKINHGNASTVEAEVQGSSSYDVRLKRDGNTLNVSCSCPYFDDSGSCKHIWATISVAELLGYLLGRGGVAPHSIYEEVDEDGPYDDGDDGYDDEYDDDESCGPETDSDIDRVPARPAPNRRQKGVRVPLWKQQLQLVRQVPATTAPAVTSQWGDGRQLVYIVDIADTVDTRSLVVDLASRKRKQNGEWSKPSGSALQRRHIADLPDPADRRILTFLTGAQDDRYYYAYGGYDRLPGRVRIPTPMLDALLPMLCATGRCFLRETDGNVDTEPLQWDLAGPWELLIHVQRDESGKHYLVEPQVRRGSDQLALNTIRLAFSGGFIVRGQLAAPLAHHGAMAWIALGIKQGGPVRVPVRQGSELIGELVSAGPLPPIELPDELQFERVSPAPTPVLKVRRPKQHHQWRPDVIVADVLFDYDGIMAGPEPVESFYQAERRRLIVRNRDAEREAHGVLRGLGFRPASYYLRDEAPLELTPSKLPKAVRAVTAAGWRVEADGKLYRSPGEIRIEVASGIDWFELHGTVQFGDTTAKLPALLQALKRGQDTVVLDDGSVGMLPEAWLKKYGVLAGLGTTHDDHLRFTTAQVGLLDALLASQPEATCDAVFQQARDELRRFDGVDAVDPPPGFVGQLRGYQRDGLGWMHFLSRFGFGGCLADDMGLGKTVQVLALLECRRVQREAAASSPDGPASRRTNGTPRAKAGAPNDRPGTSLVVMPKSLVFNWTQEAARFTPQLRLLDHTGIERTKSSGHFEDYDAILTTYGTLRRDALIFKDFEFDLCILDEAQAIKNAATESAKAARLLRARHRLALSGTPVENHLGELWSLFEFLNPGMLGTASVFQLGGAGTRNPDPHTRELLAKALRPFILRRTKDQVAKDLPPKLEQTLYCEMEATQRKLYDELRDHYRASLLGRIDREGINKSKILILEALLRLRQAACHPGLIDRSRTGEPSAKLDMLLPQLAEVTDEGHKVLVFSQFTSFLAILRKKLDAEKIPYAYLDGKTRDRKAKVEQFQNDADCKLFLISLKAGGLGLNLTAAEYVFLLDPWWNPAVESQAIDRTHRIGQTRQVFAYRLIARDTVEEKVLELQRSKRNLADSIINADNSLIRDLAREDLELLLS